MDNRIPFLNIPMGKLSENEAEFVLSLILGPVAIFLTAVSNRYKWSAGLKFGVCVLICVLVAIFQLTLQGELAGLPLLKAGMVILTSSQAFYKSKWIKDLAEKIEINLDFFSRFSNDPETRRRRLIAELEELGVVVEDLTPQESENVKAQ